LIDRLNDLITKNYDAEKGYEKTAALVEDSQLSTFFKHQAKSRYDFGHVLKAEIKSTGGDIDKGTGIKGDLHRAWMSVKDTFTGTDGKATLEGVINGEETAVAEYKEVLQEATLAPTTQKVMHTYRWSLWRMR
jgi:uncharacterized protein (TIGR02284 family)